MASVITNLKQMEINIDVSGQGFAHYTLESATSSIIENFPKTNW